MKNPYRKDWVDFYVYVAGPYTKGDVAINVQSAIRIGNTLSEYSVAHSINIVPYIPHLTHFWHLMHSHPIDFWYDYDLKWLTKCDALYRIPGKSNGADDECRWANNNGIFVAHNITELEGWIKTWKQTKGILS